MKNGIPEIGDIFTIKESEKKFGKMECVNVEYLRGYIKLIFYYHKTKGRDTIPWNWPNNNLIWDREATMLNFLKEVLDET